MRRAELRNPEVLVAAMAAATATNATLAKETGCTAGTINHLRTGRMGRCTVDLGRAIAETLGVPFADLFSIWSSDQTRQQEPST